MTITVLRTRTVTDTARLDLPDTATTDDIRRAVESLGPDDFDDPDRGMTVAVLAGEEDITARVDPCLADCDS